METMKTWRRKVPYWPTVASMTCIWAQNEPCAQLEDRSSQLIAAKSRNMRVGRWRGRGKMLVPANGPSDR